MICSHKSCVFLFPAQAIYCHIALVINQSPHSVQTTFVSSGTLSNLLQPVWHCQIKCLLQGRIRAIIGDLKRKLDARKTANHLFQRGALNDKEFNQIKSLCNNDLPIRAAEELLNIVLSQTDDFFDCFLNALKSTDQLDVHQWIVLEGLSCFIYSYITHITTAINDIFQTLTNSFLASALLVKR